MAWVKPRMSFSRAEISRRWRARNPDYFPRRNKAYYAANKKSENERVQRRAQTHPQERRVINSNRRARKRKAEGNYNTTDINALFKTQKGRCAAPWCRCEAKLTVDHKIPLSRGGSNWPSNLQLLYQPCNNQKFNKTMEEWIATRHRIGECVK